MQVAKKCLCETQFKKIPNVLPDFVIRAPPSSFNGKSPPKS